MIHKTEREKLVELVGEAISQNEAIEDTVYTLLPDNGYSIPMALRCAVGRCNDIVDRLPRYSSADHGTAFKALVTVLDKCLGREPKVFFGPYFDVCIVEDPIVEVCYQHEWERVYLQNVFSSVANDYWVISWADDHFRVALAPSIRRSALHLLSVKTEFFSYDPDVRRILSAGTAKLDLARFNLEHSLGELDLIVRSTPAAWASFENKLGFSSREVRSFCGFIGYLQNAGVFLWYQANELWEIWQDYVQQYDQRVLDESQFYALLDFFTAKPGEALKWGIPVPFLAIYDWYIFWPFCNHVLHPTLAFLALVVRKKQDDWSRTVGAQLDRVASYISNSLPALPSVRVSSLKRRKGVGDIDLAVYNEKSRHLLLCEIKTVFDRFRTNYQLTSFMDQKVDFEKAIKQLRRAQAAIASGEWRLSDIVGPGVTERPKTITPVILTWWDIVNPNIGTENEDILCCNFRTFQYLYGKANGDLLQLRDTIDQLSKLYCVARLSQGSFTSEAGEVRYIIEVQTDALPPLSRQIGKDLCELAQDESMTLARLPEDWEAQAVGHDEDPRSYHFYD